MNRITATDGLLCHKRTIKLYDSLLKRACDQYSLSPVEITIISFLHNNPSQDTAGEIAELRSLPKGNVSQGVESLIQKSLISRRQDKTDRRRIHLALTEKAIPIIHQVEQVKIAFFEQLFQGFSQEELKQYADFSKRIMENVLKGSKK